MASTSAVRRTGSALRAAVIRVAVTGGLTLLACVVGSAIANASTSDGHHHPHAITDTIQADMSDLVNGVLKSLVGHQHHHVGLPGGGVSALQPPADDGNNNDQGNGNGNGNGQGNQGGQSSGGGGSASSGQGGSTSGSDSGGGDVWTGTTTVTVPTKPTPPVEQPAPPPPAPPVHVQPTTPPAPHPIEPQVQKPTEPSMGAPTGAVPDLPRNPIELPLQQPAAQPISSPTTSGTAGHDLGGANGIAGIVPPGTGFRPSPGSTTEEYRAKRVSDGVPGLPSTSPD